MSNRKLGNDFERELCELLHDNGFWVHNFAQNQAGQPADIIAVKNRSAFLIDAKVCSNNKFDLKRIEENQHSSMKLWEECGNGTGWFALKTTDGIFMHTYETLENLYHEKGCQYLSADDIRNNGLVLSVWLKICQ